MGQNGAGKTTFMKLISGHTNASKGSVTINGQKVSTAHIPEQVNFIESGTPQFNLKIEDMLYTAEKLQNNFDIDFAFQMVEKFKLNRKKKYKQLSFGMQTMVTTLLSLASNDNIILLDEPVLGFDAIMRVQFYDMLQQSFDNEPRIILVSTHILDEIAKTASQLLVIDYGKILFQTNIEEFNEKSYSITGSDKEITPFLEQLNVINKITMGGNHSIYF